MTINQTSSTALSKEEIFATISRLYTPLSDACKQDLERVSCIHTFEKPTFLVKEGEHSDKLFFIANGSARAFYVKKGKDVTNWFAFEGDFINALNSYFQNVPSPHYIEVLEPSVVLEIARADANALSEKHFDFEKLGKRIMLNTLLRLDEHVVAMQFETAKQRYTNLLRIRPDITNRVPLNYIASYLGITVETLSRIRNPKNLRKK
jgi:CRP-like cAMP-binding protein